MSHSTSAAYGPLPLDPFNLDLEQVTLIEASAGTGKTYTITTLFTRLVAMGYPVESILVVTFTEAAAAELKLRIRQRLNECETALSDENTQIDGKDELVSFLFAQPDRDMIRKRLRLAVTCFDLAAIMTIHSFCFSILKDNAFESGAYFDMELLTDSQGFLNQVATDFFSSRINDMNPLFLSFLEQAGFTPQSLVNSMARVVGRSKIKIVPTPLVFNDIGDEYSGQVKKTAQILAQEKEAIFTLIQTHKGVDKRSYSKKNLPSWLNGCVELLDGAQKTVSVFNMKEKGDPLYKFTRTRLADKTKAGHTPPDHPFFDACETLLEFTNVMEENLMALQYEFLEYYAQALAAMKQNQGACFFDDLINDLAAALEGPRRNALKQAVLDRYQGCLIDEFQDTDPGQYYIFSTLFSTLASHCPGDDGRAMPFFMIGDPKQAIYGFRGGDIFAYLAASRTCKQSFTLTTNYRSAPKVVQGINNIFLRIKNPFGFKEIPFFPVDTPDYAVDILVKESKPVPPVSFVMMNRNTMACDRSGMIKKAVAIDMLPKILATDILSILNDPHLCLKQKGSGEDESNRIFPGDMAVLVRTNDQAEAVRQALSQNNIPCFLSKTGSVFDSPQAIELFDILSAVDRPEHTGLVKAAMVSSVYGATESFLLRLKDEDELMAGWQDRFRDYRRIWEEKGFVPMISRLIHDDDPELSPCADLDERGLTNIYHLVELLSQAALDQGADRSQSRSMLLRWFRNQLFKDTREQTADELRLESDDKAVAIVTIHKSKGLEYPIVFLPYLWAGTRSIDKSGPAVFHDPLNQDELIFDLGSEDIDRARELMALEQETEEMRLLYVALTRASAMCRIYWGGFAGAERSALGKLLHPSGCKEDAAMAQDLEKLCDQVPSCIEVTVPAAGYAQDKFSQSDEILIQPLAPRVMKRKVKSNWRISSYSALISGQNVHFEENQTPENWEPEPQTTLLNQTGSDEPVLLETFPKGARAGDFFHGVLEDIDFSDQTTIEPAVIRNLDKFGLTGTGSDHLVCDALRDIISSSLNPEDGTEFRLEDITQENRFTELEFSFSLDQFNYREMAGLFAGFNETADYAARLSGMDIPVFKGFLKGFVDLVVRHDNKWYILDYKSNYLGPEYKDYQGQNVNEAMVSHDYILQYHLYLAALDRYLALRLPGYDYNVHFGGVFYLFIRGMKPDLDTGIYYHKPSSMFMDKFRKIL